MVYGLKEKSVGDGKKDKEKGRYLIIMIETGTTREKSEIMNEEGRKQEENEPVTYDKEEDDEEERKEKDETKK